MSSESGETELLKASEAGDEPRQQAENGVPASFEPSKLAVGDDTLSGSGLEEVTPRRISSKEGRTYICMSHWSQVTDFDSKLPGLWGVLAPDTIT